MLNLEESLAYLPSYITQRDFYLKGIVYASGVLIFIEILRGQVSEVKILQLVPGLYFFLLLLSFLFLLVLSTIISQGPLELDKQKVWGTKTTIKTEFFVILKLYFFVFSAGMLFVLNTIIPLSLDFFNSTGRKTLDNTWSFGEVLGLEIFLLLVLSLLFQLPILFSLGIYNEKTGKIFPSVWKPLSIIIFIFAGLITPTVDGYTQLSLAAATFSLYLIVVTILLKRLNIKSNNLVSLY